MLITRWELLRAGWFAFSFNGLRECFNAGVNLYIVVVPAAVCFVVYGELQALSTRKKKA